VMVNLTVQVLQNYRFTMTKCSWAYGKEKIRGAERNFARLFRIVPELSKKISRETFQNCCRRGGGEKGLRKIPIRFFISHKIDRISHKIDRICPIYFYNKPILPDCEANIARLALFAQQTGEAAAPLAPRPVRP
jgi:hypothetical protein